MERLMTALLELSLPMAVVIAVLLAAGPLLGRRFTAKWRYWAWLFIAVRLLLPVGIPLPQPVIILPQPQGEITYPVRAGETTAPTPAGDPILVLPGDTADEPGRETGTATPAGEPIGVVPEQPVSDPYRQIEPGMTAPGTEQSAPVTPPAAAAQTPSAPPHRYGDGADGALLGCGRHIVFGMAVGQLPAAAGDAAAQLPPRDRGKNTGAAAKRNGCGGARKGHAGIYGGGGQPDDRRGGKARFAAAGKRFFTGAAFIGAAARAGSLPPAGYLV